MMRLEQSPEYVHIVTTYALAGEAHATCSCRWHAVFHPADPLLLAEAIAEHLGPVTGYLRATTTA